MSFIKKSASAFGKLLIVAVLAGTFLVGLLTVVYLRLQGEQMKVPDIVGKDFVQSESELAELGLKIKKRADRASAEKPNTVIEQLPKAGETVKTGQMILVVTSKGGATEGEEAPATLKKNTNEQDDSEKIEELISDKPKKTNKTNQNANSNKKKISTTRDVLSDNSNSNSNSTNSSNANKKGLSDSNADSSDKSNKNTPVNSNGKPPVPATKNTETPKPVTGKTPAATDARPRKTPNR